MNIHGHTKPKSIYLQTDGYTNWVLSNIGGCEAVEDSVVHFGHPLFAILTPSSPLILWRGQF
jgi:hypothetical protein